MRTGITFEVCVADRARLEAVVADRNSPQKHVWRAGIILATADGAGTVEIMRRTGKSKPCVWRWQERFMAEGVDGLLRDKTRPSRIPPLEPGVVLRIVDLTLTRSARRGDPLDGRHDGREARRFRLFCATHLACPRAPASSGAPVQALQRRQLRRQATDAPVVHFCAAVDSPAQIGRGHRNLRFPRSRGDRPSSTSSAVGRSVHSTVTIETLFQNRSRERVLAQHALHMRNPMTSAIAAPTRSAAASRSRSARWA